MASPIETLATPISILLSLDLFGLTSFFDSACWASVPLSSIWDQAASVFERSLKGSKIQNVNGIWLHWIGRKLQYKNHLLGGSPGLVVMGGDSCTEGRGFNPVPNTGWTFFTLICSKIVLMFVWKRPKLNEKVAGDGPFLKIISYNFRFSK